LSKSALSPTVKVFIKARQESTNSSASKVSSSYSISISKGFKTFKQFTLILSKFMLFLDITF